MDDGELEQVITVERSEMTNEGTVDSYTEEQDIGSHDKEAFMATLKREAIGTVLVSAFHMYWGYHVPLVVGTFVG